MSNSHANIHTENSYAETWSDCPGHEPEEISCGEQHADQRHVVSDGGFVRDDLAERASKSAKANAGGDEIGSARRLDGAEETPVNEPAPIQQYGKSASGGMRESIGTKIDTGLVPYELICAAAAGLNYGKQKYSARNFEKGMLMTSLLGSIERHNQAMKDGEDLDASSGLPHYVLLASSVAMLVHNIVNGIVEDDRPIAKKGMSAGDVAQFFQNVLNKSEVLRNVG